jgi:hypothetical protein
MVKSDIKWTISGGLIFFQEISSYLDGIQRLVKSKNPIVNSVHDCPPGLIWQGGRYIPWGRYCLDEYIDFVKVYNKRGIGVNYTFSNILLKDEHLPNQTSNHSSCHCKANCIITTHSPRC